MIEVEARLSSSMLGAANGNVGEVVVKVTVELGALFRPSVSVAVTRR